MDNFLGVILISVLVCAWATHLLWAFATNAWLALLVGCLILPIGILHGFYLWVT